MLREDPRYVTLKNRLRGVIQRAVDAEALTTVKGTREVLLRELALVAWLSVEEALQLPLDLEPNGPAHRAQG